ncbi:MAG: [Stomatobaculum sp.]|nr:[citrate (pro-3S)-lyase] ligase [Stomatobaculum sp.]
MSDYSISEIRKNDRYAVSQMDSLLKEEGIRRDENLDYSCGLYDEDYELVGTGSCFGNTLRCLAVSHAHQGEGLMNEIVTHLINVQFARGNTHLFVYTKCSSAKFFADLGFREIVRIEDQVVFMENSWSGFDSYLKKLKEETARQTSSMPGPDSGSAPAAEGTAAAGTETAAVVMNANPFTLGHRYLVEKAALENRLLHLFIVSEDASLVPFSVRKQLVMEGTADLKNIVYHDSGPYIISSATFPSYFQKDSDAVIESHARLDIDIFSRIAAALGITRRYVGEEPFSVVTSAYNRIMGEVLPQHGVELVVVPRKESDGAVISASTVRTAIKEENWPLLETLVPESTLRFFRSAEAAALREKIRAAENVVHY